jgi:hypothetical protein
LDLLSANTFHNEGLRSGIWKETIEHFLPIVINPIHGKRAEKLMVQSLMTIAGGLKKPDFVFAKVPGMSFTHQEEAAAILTVLPRLMNQMIVQLLLDDNLESNKKQSERKKLVVESSLSDKALLGYCTFHHMLVHLMHSRPWLLKLIDHHVEQFLNSDSYRDKEHIPDLGEFLVILSLSSHSWISLAPKVLREVFTRNIRWLLRASPELKRIAATSDGIDQYRIEKSFENSKTSYRVLMFQVYFMVKFGTPSGKNTNELLQRYNQCFGRPNEALKTHLAATTRAILQVKSWPEFFSRVLIECPSKKFFTKMLIQAQKTALDKKGYHDFDSSKPSHSHSHSSYNSRPSSSYSSGNRSHGRRN